MYLIGGNSFAEMPWLRRIVFHTGIEGIDDGAFMGCRRLEEIQFPSGMKSIGNYAFLGCSGLKEIRLPQSLSFLGSNSFSGCFALKSVQIPSSVEKIGAWAFLKCPEMTLVCVEGTMECTDSLEWQGDPGNEKSMQDNRRKRTKKPGSLSVSEIYRALEIPSLPVLYAQRCGLRYEIKKN